MTAVATIVALPDVQPCIARENHCDTPEPKKREMEQASPAREGGEFKMVNSSNLTPCKRQRRNQLNPSVSEYIEAHPEDHPLVEALLYGRWC